MDSLNSNIRTQCTTCLQQDNDKPAILTYRCLCQAERWARTPKTNAVTDDAHHHYQEQQQRRLASESELTALRPLHSLNVTE